MKNIMNKHQWLRGEKFSWFFSVRPWGMTERFLAALLVLWGITILLPGPTFTISHTWHFIAVVWGSDRWGYEVAETLFGGWQLLLGAHQLWQLRVNNRKWRRIGMFLMMLNFATRCVGFAAANIYFQEVGTGWADALLYTALAAIAWVAMGAYWHEVSVGVKN